MIHAGDVVVIDGNNGHDYIDLRGYSVNDALFHGDTIEINKGTENHFVIQFKNVREALFAGDVKEQFLRSLVIATTAQLR